MAKNLGEIIRQKIREDGRTAKVICEELGMSRGNLDKIYHKDSFNTDLLAQFSLVLSYDFFRHANPFRKDEPTGPRPYSHLMVVEDTGSNPPDMGDLNQMLTELNNAQRELDFLERNLEDVKSSLHDKDEIISLQKDKITYLQEKLDAHKGDQ